jgi:tetratricopeptide (TPR) repeat protein
MRTAIYLLTLLLATQAQAREHRWKSFKIIFGFEKPLGLDDARTYEARGRVLHYANRQEPEDSKVIFDTAMNLFALREYEQAAEQYYRLLQKHPRDGQLFIRFVQSLYMTGDFEAVKKTAALAEKEGMHNTLNLILVADIAYSEGRNEVATRLLKAILTRLEIPDTQVSESSICLSKTYALENLITLYTETGDTESVSAYEALLERLKTDQQK